MNVNFTTKVFTTKEINKGDKSYYMFKACDVVTVDCYTFFIDEELKDLIDSVPDGTFLMVNGYVKFDDGRQKAYLRSLCTLEGERLYEYNK